MATTARLDSDAAGGNASPTSKTSRGTPRSQKKSDRARERERVLLTLYKLKTSKSESDLCESGTYSSTDFRSASILGLPTAASGSAVGEKKRKMGTTTAGGFSAPFTYSDHFFMSTAGREEDQFLRVATGKSAFTKKSPSSPAALPLSFSLSTPHTPATSSTAHPGSPPHEALRHDRHQFDWSKKGKRRSRSSGGNLGSRQYRRHCSNQDWSTIVRAETEFQQKKEDSDDMAEEKMLSGLYKVFCSISGADNKVDVDTFVKIAYERNVFQKLGPRSDIALRSIASSNRVDWATLAWYLVSPATVGDIYFPTRQKGQCLYEFFTSCFPTLRDAFNFARARDLIRRYQGLRGLRQWLFRKNYLDGDFLDIRETAPFNFFALAGGGKLIQTNMESENECLGEYKSQFVVVRNLPHHDRHWNDPEYAGNSSMARRHRFLALKNLRYEWFNALAFGLQPDRLEEALKLIHDLQAAAKKYSENMGWSSVGLFCHIFGHNSVPSFHLHMVDLLTLGPSYFAMLHKNCKLDVVEQVLQDELKNRLSIPDRRIPDFLSPGRASGITSPRFRASSEVNDEAVLGQRPSILGRTGGSSMVDRLNADGSPMDMTIFSKLSEETLASPDKEMGIKDESLRYSGDPRQSGLDAINTTPQSLKIRDMRGGVDALSPGGIHHAKSSSGLVCPIGDNVVYAAGSGSPVIQFEERDHLHPIEINRLYSTETDKSLGTIITRPPHPTIVDFLLRLRLDEPFGRAAQHNGRAVRVTDQEVEETGARSDKKTWSPSGLRKPSSNNDNNDDDADGGDDNEVRVPHTKCEITTIHESKAKGGEGNVDGAGEGGVRGEHASASNSKSSLPGGSELTIIDLASKPSGSSPRGTILSAGKSPAHKSEGTSSGVIVSDESKDEEVVSPDEALGEGSSRKYDDKKGVSDSPTGHELEEHGSEDTQTRRGHAAAAGGSKKRKKEGKHKNKNKK